MAKCKVHDVDVEKSAFARNLHSNKFQTTVLLNETDVARATTQKPKGSSSSTL